MTKKEWKIFELGSNIGLPGAFVLVKTNHPTFLTKEEAENWIQSP